MLAHTIKMTAKMHLRRLDMFSQMKDVSLEGIADYAQIKFEKKGAVLFSPDAPNDKFYVVISGWVKLFRETLGGEEAVIDVLTGGHVFGEVGLSGSQGMPYGATVIEDAEILSFPRFLLAEEVMRNSLFGLSVLQSMTRQKIERDMEIEHRMVQSAPQRVGCFLLRLCGDVDSGAVTLNLPYDKTVVASRLGMQPETFSRALVRLREEVGIRVKGASVEIDDIRKLANYTCSACSSTFPCEDKKK